MTIEQRQNSEDNREKYKDFRNALSDSKLDDIEKRELVSEYYSECEKIHEETQDECTGLQREVELYKEMTRMSRSEIKILQTIIGFIWNQRDSLRGPSTFAWYMDLGERYPMFIHKWPKEITDNFLSYIRDFFEWLNQYKKEEIQRKVGTWADGIYWRNTEKKILQNFHKVRDIFLGQSVVQKEETSEAPVDDENTEEIEDIFVEEVEESEVVNSLVEPQIWTWDHQPKEKYEQLTREEKIEKFIWESRGIHRKMVRFLQKAVQTPVDWSFGPNSANAVIKKYPEAQSLEEVMHLEWIPIQGDKILPIVQNNPESKREIFRELYWEYVDILEENLNLPQGLIESIIRQETKHWTYGWLISYSGCKWFMQLSRISIQDMKTWHRGNIRNYKESFQNIDLDRLMSLPIWNTGRIIRETVPSNIIKGLYMLKDSKISDHDYNLIIEELKVFIKWDNTYFNHAVNMILWSVYLSGTYHDYTVWYWGLWDILTTADLYNASASERVKYRNNVVSFFNEYHED